MVRSRDEQQEQQQNDEVQSEEVIEEEQQHEMPTPPSTPGPEQKQKKKKTQQQAQQQQQPQRAPPNGRKKRPVSESSTKQQQKPSREQPHDGGKGGPVDGVLDQPGQLAGDAVGSGQELVQNTAGQAVDKTQQAVGSVTDTASGLLEGGGEEKKEQLRLRLDLNLVSLRPCHRQPQARLLFLMQLPSFSRNWKLH